MKKLIMKKLATISICISFVSCEAVLQDTGLSTAMGAGIGAGLGSAIDKDNRGRGALLGGAAGGLAGFLISKNYQATQAQARRAEQLAAQAARRSSTKQKLASNKAKYIAVPVKPSGSEQRSSNAKNMVMVCDAETGKPVSNKVYVPQKSYYSSGEVATIGGRKSVVSTGFSGL